jgi:hypothetical protein
MLIHIDFVHLHFKVGNLVLKNLENPKFSRILEQNFNYVSFSERL